MFRAFKAWKFQKHFNWLIECYEKFLGRIFAYVFCALVFGRYLLSIHSLFKLCTVNINHGGACGGNTFYELHVSYYL